MDKIEIDRTEQEREELVKQFIKDYWLVAVLAVGGAIGLVYGLEYYKKRQFTQYNDAAATLSEVEKTLKNGELEAAEASVLALQSQSGQEKSSFSTVATFELAKGYFDEGQYDKAIAQYDWLINNAPDEGLKNIALLRKARVLADSDSANEALDVLAQIDSANFNDEAQLLRGDIHLSLAQYDQAKAAYEAISETINPQLVQQRMMIADVKASQQSAQ